MICHGHPQSAITSSSTVPASVAAGAAHLNAGDANFMFPTQFCKENRAPTTGAVAGAADEPPHVRVPHADGAASAATARRKALAQMLEEVRAAACRTDLHGSFARCRTALPGTPSHRDRGRLCDRSRLCRGSTTPRHGTGRPNQRSQHQPCCRRHRHASRPRVSGSRLPSRRAGAPPPMLAVQAHSPATRPSRQSRGRSGRSWSSARVRPQPVPLTPRCFSTCHMLQGGQRQRPGWVSRRVWDMRVRRTG